MALLVVTFVLSLIITIAAGGYAHRRSWSVQGGPIAWGNAAARRLGRARAGVLIAAAGWIVTAAVSVGLGLFAKALEDSVDRPAFDWIHPRVHDNAFTRLNEKLTFMGNNPIVQVVSLVAVIVLVSAYQRRWWLPVLAIAGAYFSEHYIQKFLAKVVDRGHPPTTHGTFPSGGVARILAVYGTIIVLIILLDSRLSRAWRAGLWTGVTTAAVVETFTRIYLSKHWLTDAVLGLAFGAMLMLTNLAAVAALSHDGPESPETSAPRGRHLAASAP